MLLPLLPIWIIDLLGATAMIVLSIMCLRIVLRIYTRDPEDALASYLLWFFLGILAFSFSRPLGHILKYFLFFTGHQDVWIRISPISGSVNTMVFIMIAATTMFFHRIQKTMSQMARDRQRIENTSRELLKLNEDLEDIVSQRTMAEMALRVAHEIRNPVMIIGGLIRHILKEGPCSRNKDPRLQKIMDQAQKLESLVSRFEDVRPVYKRFAPQDLNILVKDSVDAVRIEAENKNIRLRFRRFKSPLIFQGNGRLIKIAVIHLLRNAVDACKRGCEINVTTGLAQKGILLKIEDNGPGIPEDVLKHIFEAFVRTEQGETGLGIPYVRQIIEEHRGKISIKSEKDKGTIVEILLPTHVGALHSS